MKVGDVGHPPLSREANAPALRTHDLDVVGAGVPVDLSRGDHFARHATLLVIPAIGVLAAALHRSARRI